jgi:uncharacterized DUF497 family protein
LERTRNAINKAKHGVSFETAKLFFNDPLHISIQDCHELEHRWQTLGLINGLLMLLVAYTIHEENNIEMIRIISARKATKQERRCYEQAH